MHTESHQITEEKAHIHDDGAISNFKDKHR